MMAQAELVLRSSRIKRVMRMTSTTPSLSARSSGTLQLALLTAMLPNALGSRVAMGGQSIFWMTSITIPLWFVVVIVLVAMAVAWYLINEIRGLRKSLFMAGETFAMTWTLMTVK